jgi:hypothetical protein
VALVETERFAAEPEAGGRRGTNRAGQTETERRYLISTHLKPGGQRREDPTGAEKILEASRGHWQIETGLHWVLVAFREDHSQVRTQNAAENPALMRRLVASVVKEDQKVDAGTNNKRKRAGWDEEYREYLLQKL